MTPDVLVSKNKKITVAKEINVAPSNSPFHQAVPLASLQNHEGGFYAKPFTPQQDDL